MAQNDDNALTNLLWWNGWIIQSAVLGPSIREATRNPNGTDGIKTICVLDDCQGRADLLQLPSELCMEGHPIDNSSHLTDLCFIVTLCAKEL